MSGKTSRVPLPRDRAEVEGAWLLFDRQAAGSHEIRFSASSNRYTTVPNHPGDMPEGTLRAILRQAGIDPEEFLTA